MRVMSKRGGKGSWGSVTNDGEDEWHLKYNTGPTRAQNTGHRAQSTEHSTANSSLWLGFRVTVVRLWV